MKPALAGLVEAIQSRRRMLINAVLNKHVFAEAEADARLRRAEYALTAYHLSRCSVEGCEEEGDTPQGDRFVCPAHAERAP